MDTKPFDSSKLRKMMEEALDACNAPESVRAAWRDQTEGDNVLMTVCFDDKELEEFARLYPDHVEITRLPLQVTEILHKKMSISEGRKQRTN